MNHQISVSKEYIESVCDWITVWAKEEDSWTIPQFLKKYGIGWTYFRYMMDSYPQLHLAFETVIAGLHSKWLDYAMKNKNLSSHIQKILMKYLYAYDNHIYYMNQQAKKELAEKSNFFINNYATEDYSKEDLTGLYKSLYEENTKKQIS